MPYLQTTELTQYLRYLYDLKVMRTTPSMDRLNIASSLMLLMLLMLPVYAETGEEFTRSLVAREVTGRTDLRSQQPQANSGPVLLAKDFGLSPNASPADNAKALDLLGAALTQKKASAVRFEAGDFIGRTIAILICAQQAQRSTAVSFES